MSDRITDLVREFTGGVWRLAARITGDPEEARDVTQDVMVRMLTRAGSLRDPSRLKAYLFRSAYHAALNATRSRRRRDQAHASLARDVAAEPLSDPAGIARREQADRQLRAAIAQLADRQREVITLRFYAGLTLTELAATLNISEGTARVHLARALTNLKSILAPAGKEH